MSEEPQMQHGPEPEPRSTGWLVAAAIAVLAILAVTVFAIDFALEMAGTIARSLGFNV